MLEKGGMSLEFIVSLIVHVIRFNDLSLIVDRVWVKKYMTARNVNVILCNINRTTILKIREETFLVYFLKLKNTLNINFLIGYHILLSITEIGNSGEDSDEIRQIVI